MNGIVIVASLFLTFAMALAEPNTSPNVERELPRRVTHASDLEQFAPSSDNLVQLSLELVQSRKFRPGDAIEFSISIKNVTHHPILACKEDWASPTGLITFKVFDGQGREVSVKSKTYIDYYVDEETYLKPLGPGEMHSGKLDLTASDTVYDFKNTSYFVVASYYCPFDGEGNIDRDKAWVANKPQRSLPVEIHVDYRPWWVRLLDPRQ